MELPTRTKGTDETRVSRGAPEASSLPEGYGYWAFISYSHADEAVVKWLHSALETYKVPRQIVGRDVSYGKVPRRVYPLFRDREEFRGAADLTQETKDALRLSHSLVVVCSPAAARSKWVNDEIITFKAMGREGRVFCLIVGGEPHAGERPGGEAAECFPPALLHRVNSLGEPTGERVEPIAADLREDRDGKVNARLKLLAGLLDVRYDELRQRERRRRLRQRVRLSAGLALLLLLSVAGYLTAADAGFDLPGGERFRTFLDRHEASLLRPVHELPEIRRAASSLRSDYLGIIKQRRREGGGLRTNIDPAEGDWVDVWSYSQAACAVLSAPEASRADKLDGLSLLEAPFAPGVAVEAGGRRHGWVGLEDKQNTQAEPAFWTAIALITALGQPRLLDEQARRRASERLSYTEEVLKLYRPSPSGGWNMFVKQENPSLHNTYATALALLTLLEAKRAGLPWEGSAERRDELLEAAARWLIKTYDAEAATPGWRETGDGRYEIYDGLTLQIYAELLRAEAEAGVELPPEILRQIPLHVIRCLGRDLSAPDESGEFSANITDHRGQSYNATATDTFMWYPWAVSCAALWTERAQKFQAPTEERVRVRRSLDYMVIGVGRQAVEKSRASDWTYEAAETLYVLSRVWAPPGSNFPSG